MEEKQSIIGSHVGLNKYTLLGGGNIDEKLGKVSFLVELSTTSGVLFQSHMTVYDGFL